MITANRSILLSLTLAVLLSGIAVKSMALDIPPVPMAVRINASPNVLFVLDNSNSMDEAPNGSAVGSDSPESKSEIARRVAGNLVATYTGQINLGLMAYRQNAPQAYYLHNAPYDASYNPANYDPIYIGDRDSATKRYRVANPSDPGSYIYFNVALPFYDSTGQGNAFCYSATADFDNGGESALAGPWDTYTCWRTKTGSSDVVPANDTEAAAAGYATKIGNFTFSPTDSDYAQNILDFGALMNWTQTGRTWFRNDSPGRGYLHTPIQALNSAQAGNINDKLDCNIPGDPSPCTTAGIKNAGLTPIEGTLLTARDYFTGGWSVASEGYTESCYPLPESCGLNFVILLTDGLPSTTAAGATIADPATAIAQAASAAEALKAERVETYVVGFALPYGVDPATLDTIAVKGGTDKAYTADDEASLQTALSAIFSDVLRKVGSASNLSANSERISSRTKIFQTTFNSQGWTGEVLAYPVSSSGVLTPIWRATDSGNIPSYNQRKVYTRNDSTGEGVVFVREALSASQQATLGDTAAHQDDLINFIKGDKSKEAPSGSYRHRNGPLGDIVNSSPRYNSETDTLFVGANDGMLHALNAATGQELFTYIPSAVISKLPELAKPEYSHLFYVDGDIDVSTQNMGNGANILVAALGRGAKGLFGLDVTTPSAFDPGDDVLWEYGGADANMGYVLGRPVLATLNDGSLAVISGNGYNSTSGRAVLFLLDARTGVPIVTIDTLVDGDNGLSAPGVVDSDTDGRVDYVYAGDFKGNLWKFDLSGADKDNWRVAFGSSGTPLPLFVAKNDSNELQFISAAPTTAVNDVTGDPNYGKRFVFFGTGRYLTADDIPDATVQSWYGVIDESAAIVGTRSSVLTERTISTPTTVAGKKVRVVSQAVANDMASKKGWFIDLPETGERIVSRSIFLDLIEPVLEASSIIPETAACGAGGSGYINAINPFTGARNGTIVFDVNGDFRFDNSDTVDGKPVGSIGLDVGLPAEPLVLGAESGYFVNLITGSNANIVAVGKQGKAATAGRRNSWREIVR